MYSYRRYNNSNRNAADLAHDARREKEMTMADFWAQVLAEFKALGWDCVMYGPEIWLAMAALAIAGMLMCLVGALVIPRLDDEKEEDDDP